MIAIRAIQLTVWHWRAGKEKKRNVAGVNVHVRIDGTYRCR